MDDFRSFDEPGDVWVHFLKEFRGLLVCQSPDYLSQALIINVFEVPAPRTIQSLASFFETCCYINFAFVTSVTEAERF